MGEVARCRKTTDYMPQLDGLRTLAVVGVFAQHALPRDIVDALEPGAIGVRLFFVLSGFLITCILLRAKSEAALLGGSKAKVLIAFYARRLLRIFPLYYFVLALAFRYQITEAIEGAPWHLAYLTNVYCFLIEDWIGPLSHFWSLAVEEQFYLFWPLIVLYTPNRWLGAVIGFVVLFAPIFRVLAYVPTENSLVEFLTPACLDTLGIGALLAYCWEYYDSKKIGRCCHCLAVIGLVLFGVIKTAQQTCSFGALMHVGFMSFSLAMICVWVINFGAKGFDGLVGRFLASRPMIFLGMISYGMYVWHNFGLHLFAWRLSGRFGIDIGYPVELGWKRLVYVSLFSVVAATFSWYLFEKHINKLKRYFPYVAV